MILRDTFYSIYTSCYYIEGASSPGVRVAAHMTFLDFVAFGKNAAAKLLAAGNKSESCSTLASRVS